MVSLFFGITMLKASDFESGIKKRNMQSEHCDILETNT